jgi:hypothetical protein
VQVSPLLSFLLEFSEVVVQPIKSLVQRLLVLGQPVMHRAKARRFEAVQPAAAVRP